MKKLLYLIILLVFITGCTDSKDNNKVVVNGETIKTNKMEHKHCTRQGKIGTGSEVQLNYDLYYTGDVLNVLYSVEKVISSNEEILNQYQKAYESIHAHYKDLEYYDTKVTRGDTTVTSEITINYDKVDIVKLLDIEGEEDNIIENGKAKVDKWLELAKKLGTTCEVVEE